MEPYQENMLDEEGHIQSQQLWQRVTFEQGRCPARTEHRETVFVASFLQFPGVADSIHLHNMHRLSIMITLDYPKGLRPSSSLVNECS